MAQVTVELWLNLGDELGPDWEQPSLMRSLLRCRVEPGTTIRSLFGRLINDHPLLAEKVFDRDRSDFRRDVVVIVNGRALSEKVIPDARLDDGAIILVTPPYVGG